MDPLSTLLFENSIARIGSFRCPAHHPHFADSGPIRYGHLIVFPRTAVRIVFAGCEPLVVDPTTVMFYNYQQSYRRELLSQAGDCCEWFAFAPTLLAAALADCQCDTATDIDQPFQLHHAPSDPQSYLLQRLIVTHLLQQRAQQEAADTLWLDEALLTLLSRAIAYSYAMPQTTITYRPDSQTIRRQAEMVRTVQAHLATTFMQKITLADLASTVYLSPYELCRIFRAHSGRTIHAHLTQLRLRHALSLLPDYAGDLTTLALELGYSSHSHFSNGFRRAFGVTPARLCKKSGNIADVMPEKMRKNLIV